MPVELLDSGVVRLAAWPVEALDGLCSPAAVAAAAAYGRAVEEQGRAARRLADGLHDAVPGMDRDVRRAALAARRSLFRLGTARDGAWVGALPEDDVRAWRAAADRCRVLHDAASTSFQDALQRETAALERVTGEEAFRRAVALASPDLARAGTDLAAQPRDARRRRRTEALLSYLLRAAGRPTPHGAWAVTAALLPGPDPGLVLREVPTRRRVTVDPAPLLALVAACAAGPDGDGLLLRLRGGARVPGWRPGEQVRLRDLPGDRRAAAVTALGAGLLDLVLPTGDPDDPLRAVRTVADGLSGAAAARVGRLLDEVTDLCDDLARRWEQLGGADVLAAQDTLRRLVEDGGLPAGQPVPRLRLDATAPVEARWGPDLRGRLRRAVEDLLRLTATDGSAERFRVEVTRRRLGLSGAADPGSGPPRWPWADGTGDEEAAVAARWSDLLRADAVAGAAVTVVPALWLRTAPARALTGDHLVALDPGGTPWLLRGRPQPGLAAARLVGLLGLQQLWADLSRALAARGATALRLVRPASLQTAARPATRCDSTGPALVARGLEVDADSRVWVRGEPRRAPVHPSAARPDGTDPDDALALAAAFSHGWEYLAFGLPHLPEELAVWHHLPRVVLPGGPVLSGRRWVLPSATVAAWWGRTEVDRWLSWCRWASSEGVPDRVGSRVGADPVEDLLPVPRDSVLAVGHLLSRAAAAGREVVLQELPDAGRGTVRTPAGTHRAELAITWFADP